MNIAFDGRVAIKQLGGISEYTYQLLAALGKIDHANSYSVLTVGRDKAKLGSLPDLPHNFQQIHKDWPQKALDMTWRYANWPKVTSWLPKHDLFYSPHFLLPAGDFKRLVVTIHDVLFLDHPEWFLASDVERYTHMVRSTLKKADMAITISQTSRDALIAHELIAPDKIKVIPIAGQIPPTTSDLDKATKKRYQLPDEYLLYIGTIQPRKNILNQLKAYAILRGQGHTLPFIFAGERGWLGEELEQTVAKLKLGEHVRFIGGFERKEKTALFQGARAFLFPSLAEGFGLPVLEAMQAGVPVVTSNISSLPEVAGDAAELVDPTDPETIAQGVAAILSNSTHSKSLIMKGKKQAETFSWERTAKETLAVFELFQ